MFKGDFLTFEWIIVGISLLNEPPWCGVGGGGSDNEFSKLSKDV